MARADLGRTSPNRTRRHASRLVVLFGILSLVGASLLMPATKGSAPPGTAIVNVATVTATVQPGAPPAVSASNRTVTLISTITLGNLGKSVAPTGTVRPAADLRYTLSFANPSSATLTNVTIVDPLDPFIAAVAGVTSVSIPNRGTGGGRVPLVGAHDPASRRVTWTFPSLPPGFRGEVEFTATLAASIPDQSVVRNSFSASSDQDPAGAISPEVSSAVLAPSLTLSLLASRERIEVGDLVGFTLTVTNVSASTDLVAAAARLTLPPAFRYREGSLRVAGTKGRPSVSASDPRELRIDVGDLPRGESREITLVGVAGAATRRGTVVARGHAAATTAGGLPVEAAPADAILTVSQGSFASEAVIAGKVFVDSNGDGVQSANEASVPGVRLYLEDGTEVLTDIAGKYHIEGVHPGLHVMKLDPETAPAGLRAGEGAGRASGTPGVQFIDIGAVDLFKANFGLRGEPGSLSALRIDAGGPASGEAGARAPLPPIAAGALFEEGSASLRRQAEGILESCAQAVKDLGLAKGDLAVSESGSLDPILGGERARVFREALLAALGTVTPARDRLPAWESALAGATDPAGAAPGDAVPAAKISGTAGSAAVKSTGEILKSLLRGVFIVSPHPGDVVSGEFTNVEVAFPTGSHIHLAVNGEGVGEDRVGVRMQTSRSGMSLYGFMGLRLVEGENVVAAETEDDTESPQRVEVHVDRVGAPARIVVRGEGGAQSADGRTPARVLVEVRDARGHAVADGTPVTIETSQGIVLGVDAEPTAPGFQVRASSGQALARLSPADHVETRLVTATAGAASAEGTIQFGPHLRDWIVAGVGEAGWSASGTPAAGSGGELPGADNPFTGAGASTRLAFFAKGRIGEENLLAVSFDSARARDASRLFQVQDPAALFPIYGDASRQQAELPSQGRLSLRWDRRRTSVTYGDFQTGLGAAELARYDRTLSGAIANIETPALSVKAFAATTQQREVRDAFPADGSSGPYRLTRRPLVAYTERVTLEVRDRYHTERVLATSPQARYTDYDIDYSGGTILFRGPVNSADDGFNPVTIVVTYETLGSGGSDLVAGGRIGWRAGPRFEWGTTAVHEDRGGSPFSLTGMDFTLRPVAGVAVTTEYARAADGTRVAGALGLRVTASVSPSGTIGAYVRQVPTDFSNPSMSGASEVGTTKEGIEYHAAMPDGSRLNAETFRQAQEVLGVDRHGTGVTWEKPDGPLTWQAGAKEIGGTTASGSGDGTSGLVDLGVKSRIGKRLDLSALRRQIVSGTTVAGFPTRTDLGAGYKFTDQFRGFLRQEIDQGGAGSASRTLLGAQGAVSDTTTIESRYTLEDALAGERGYATMGVRTRVPITDVWSADVRAERSQTVTGSPGSDFTSLSGAAEYLPGKTKFTTQYEVRFGALDRRQLLTTAGAMRLSPDLSLFARQRLNFVEPDAAASRFDADGLVGLAFRPVDSDRYNWLGRLQAGRGEILPGGVTTLAGAPGAQGYLGIFEINVQPVPRWRLMGRYGARYAADSFAGGSLRSYTDLWEGRCLADVGKRMTAGLSARLLRQPATGTALTGVGAETGFMVVKDLWLVGGYNVTGFSDRRFPDGERRSQGPFVTLRFKFDETFLAGLKSAPAQSTFSTTTAVP